MLPGFELSRAERRRTRLMFVPSVSQDYQSTQDLLRASATSARCDREMLEKVIRSLWPFGCRHNRLSVPFSMEMVRHNEGHVDTEEDELPSGCSHYVVCLRCGRRFGYDWSSMRVVKSKLKTAG
jgi:hypothetical protein